MAVATYFIRHTILYRVFWTAKSGRTMAPGGDSLCGYQEPVWSSVASHPNGILGTMCAVCCYQRVNACGSGLVRSISPLPSSGATARPEPAVGQV